MAQLSESSMEGGEMRDGAASPWGTLCPAEGEPARLSRRENGLGHACSLGWLRETLKRHRGSESPRGSVAGPSGRRPAGS